MTTCHYRWVSADELRTKRFSSIALLRPESATRRRRWRDALRWLGATEGEQGATRWPPAKGDAVIITDDSHEALGASYARLRQRPVHLLASDVSLERQLAGWDADTLLFLGPRHTFTGPFIEEINRRWRKPWGVITGADLPAASFMLAKQHAVTFAPLRNRTAVIDEIAGEVRIAIGHRNGRAAFGENIRRLIRHDWQTLIMHVHGEGSHINLRSVVLCGLASDTEQTFEGKNVDGCANEPDGRRCKRVHDADICIATPADLRAVTLCLYSCNSFSVAGDLYPSNLSSVLSAGEGRAVGVLCSDRPAGASRDTLQACASFLSEGGTLADLTNLENDRSERFTGERPWLLFGDPAAQFRRPSKEMRKRVVVAPLPNTSAEVWAAKPAEDIRRLFVGITHATILLRQGCSSDVALHDVSALLQDRQAWLAGKQIEAQACLQMEIALRHESISGTPTTLPFRRALRRLEAVRTQLVNALSAALDVHDGSARAGSWADRLDLAWELCRALVRTWDRSFAKLVFDHLMESDLERLTLAGTSARPVQEPALCSRCGRPMIHLYGRDLTTRVLRSHALRCPVCGARAGWHSKGPRIDAVLPRTMTPGERHCLEVSISRDFEPPGFLGAAFRDKGRARAFHRQLIETDAAAIRLELAMPSNATVDLHTLRLTWTSSLHFAFLRLRSAAVREASEPRQRG